MPSDLVCSLTRYEYLEVEDAGVVPCRYGTQLDVLCDIWGKFAIIFVSPFFTSLNISLCLTARWDRLTCRQIAL